MTDPTAAEVRNFIATGLECTHLEVEGDGRHFFATIVAAEFEGRRGCSAISVSTRRSAIECALKFTRCR